MATPTLIGLSGYARSGKDTVASMLATSGYRRLAYADTLRDMALASDPHVVDPVTGGYTYLRTLVQDRGWERAKASSDVRTYLQGLGLACRDTFGDDCWVDALNRKREMGRKHVITDVRFPNEAEDIRQRGGLLVRVSRPGTGPVNGHVSETALDDFDFDVHLLNDGNLDDLNANAQLLLSKATKGQV